MNKILLFLLLICSFSSLAQSSSVINPEQVKVELINQMETDGYLSHKMANEVKNKYVNIQKLNEVSSASETSTPSLAVSHEETQLNANIPQTTASAVTWKSYLDWVNFFKIFAVGLFLVAFWGIISKFIKLVWHLIVQVPVELYQLLFLVNTLVATFYPEKIWASQAIYIALFGSVANVLIVAWFWATHEKLMEDFKVAVEAILPFENFSALVLGIYFASLAHAYHSTIIGGIAVIALSSFLSLTLYSVFKSIGISIHYRELNAYILGNFVLLMAYMFLQVRGLMPDWMVPFHYGIEYYCTLATCFTLLIAGGPFLKDHPSILYAFLFVFLLIFGMTGFYFWQERVVGSIVCCSFILFALEWVCYMAYKTGLIFGAGLLGAFLYGLALLLEKYGHYLVLYIPQTH